MKEFKGTKGPWVADIRGGCVAVYQDGKQDETPGCHQDDERNIAYSRKGAAYGEKGPYWSMSQDAICDYRLIAAAPDLLEALQSIISGYEDRGNSGMFDIFCHGDEIEKANSAIAKALGETK